MLANNSRLKRHDVVIILLYNREVFKQINFNLCAELNTTYFKPSEPISFFISSLNSFQSPSCKDALLSWGAADTHVDGLGECHILGGEYERKRNYCCSSANSIGPSLFTEWVLILDMANLVLNINIFFET